MNYQPITNGYRKINHPSCDKENIVETYEGPYHINYNFGPQTKNFEKIKSILNEFHIYPTEIIHVKWISPCGGNRTSFIVKFSDPNILWRKYDSNGEGCGNNNIYIKKRIIKLTKFNRDYIIDFL